MPLTFERFCVSRAPNGALTALTGFGTYGRMRIRHITYGLIWAAMWSCARCLCGIGRRVIPDCAGAVEIRLRPCGGAREQNIPVLSAAALEVVEASAVAGRQRPALSRPGGRRGLALAGPVTFTSTPPKEDRYDRVRAQGFGKEWFQTALLEQGLARVATWPDRTNAPGSVRGGGPRARQARWDMGAGRLPAARPPGDETRGSSCSVEPLGIVIATADGRVFIDFGSNGQRSFSAVIAPEDKRAFRDFDLNGLTAHHIRIRGTVQDYRGRPEITLSNPSQIEVLNNDITMAASGPAHPGYVGLGVRVACSRPAMEAGWRKVGTLPGFFSWSRGSNPWG